MFFNYSLVKTFDICVISFFACGCKYNNRTLNKTNSLLLKPKQNELFIQEMKPKKPVK